MAQVATPAQPAPGDEARAEAERLARERQRLAAERERLARQQAALETARRQALPEAPAPQAQTPAPAPPVPATEGAREPKPPQLRLVGNQLVPREELEALARDLMPLTRESLDTLLERLREHYADQGYVLARAVPHPPKDGVVEIELLEGRLRSLRPVGFSPQDHEAVLEAFRPVLEAGVLRKPQVAEALRRLGARHRIVARLRFEPGTEPGTVVLVVERRAFGGAGREQAPPRVPLPQESR
jgi:hemolysin activation/secretion protein